MVGRVALFNPGNRQDWRRFLTSLRSKDTYGIFLMIGEMTSFHFDDVQPLFKETGVPVFGGVFPGIICGNSWHREGILGCGIKRPVFVKGIKDLGSFNGLPADMAAAGPAGTFLVIVDGLARGISPFLDVLFETCSGRLSFIGGGAGSLGPDQKPVLFTGEECFAGGALLVGIEGPVGVGASHGWEPMYGPLVANRTESNTLVELNWQPAFANYRQVLEEKAGINITPGNFFEIAKGHPFGMVKMDGSIVVRDPIRVEDEGNIVLVGEIPENSVVIILKGDPESLISAAGEAAGQALARLREQTGSSGRGALVIDCISRVLYLGGDIDRELRAIRSNIPQDLPIFGFFSLGEIASAGDRYLEFHNKTTVVGIG